MKIRPVGAELFHAGAKAVVFCNFAVHLETGITSFYISEVSHFVKTAVQCITSP